MIEKSHNHGFMYGLKDYTDSRIFILSVKSVSSIKSVFKKDVKFNPEYLQSVFKQDIKRV